MAITRLIYGFTSQSAEPLGISVPWQVSNQDGMFKMNYSIERNTLTNLRVWAKTNWGERPGRFRFGLDAKRYLFEQERIIKDKLIENSQEQLPIYFPFLIIDNLQVLTNDDDDSIEPNTVRYILEAHFRDDASKKIKIDETIGA